MKQKFYIPFKVIPKGFKKREKLKVISFEFSGIQSFIFGSLDTDSTPDEIRVRSEYVVYATEKVLERLISLLPKKSNVRVISMSSGKLMAAVSKRIDEQKLIEASDEIQRIIYSETEGRLQVCYGVLEASVTSKYPLKPEEDAKSRLRLLINQNKYLCKNLLHFPFDEYKDESFSLIRFEEISKKSKNDREDFFASLKLDFDNLGDFFANIEQLDIRQSTSKALAHVIESAVAATEGLFPVFVGGDDIFLLLKDCNYPLIINTLYSKLRYGIENTPELSPYRPIFGISGGMSLIRNDLGKIPLFYYSDLAEAQLEKAKASKEKNCISINGKLLTWTQISALAEVTGENMDIILEGLDENRKLIILSNTAELKNRIMRLIKSEKIPKGKEVSQLESI